MLSEFKLRLDEDYEGEQTQAGKDGALIDWVGERFVPWVVLDTPEIHYEHLHRYHYATKFVAGKVVLDMAFGEGYGCAILAQNACRVVGVEIDENAVKHAQRNYLLPNVEFLRGSITEVPIKGEKLFDVITCFESIEHVEEHDALMAEVGRLLNDDGILILSSPNKLAYTDQTGARNPYHVKELYFDEFRDLLTKSFKYIRFLGQKVLPVSEIWPLGERDGHHADFCVRYIDGRFAPIGPGDKLPLYFVAVASQIQLPEAPWFSTLTDVSEELIKTYLRRESQQTRLVETLRTQASLDQESVKDLAAQVEEKDERLEELDSQMSELEQELRSQLADRDHLLEKLRSQTAELEQDLRDHLAEKERQLEALASQAARQVQDLRTRLTEKEQSLESVTSRIEELRSSLGAQLEEMERRLQALKSVTADQELASRTLAARLERRENLVDDLRTRLNERARIMALLDVALKERSSEVERMGALTIDQERIISGLLLQTAEHVSAKSLLESQLAEKEQLIDSTFERAVNAEAQLFRMTDTLGTIGSCLLRLYGWMKNDGLPGVFRFYGKVKVPHLLPVYRFLRLLPSERKPSHELPSFDMHRAQPPPTDDTSPAMEVDLPGRLSIPDVSVDVIVCVHNALDEVKDCLASVAGNTGMPYSLILIDDGSNEETRAYLARYAKSQGVTLIRNPKARGYTFAANQGLRYSHADYAVLLNSDTVVTAEWLERIVACGESDPGIGLVGPLSNAATWQSIPEIVSDGEFFANELPDDLNEADMGRLVADYSGRLYPRLPFLNGFCLAIKRRVIGDLGYFDEELFGRGYGEENDYCARATKAGWQLAVAEDAYVYHHQSRSYSPERRRELCKYADAALTAKHGVQLVTEGVTTCRTDRVMEGIRARSRVMIARQECVNEGKVLWEGKRIAFILPVDEPGGGANVILSEAEAMRKMGADVTVINLTSKRTGFERSYHDNEVPVIYVNREADVAGLCSDYDAVVATWCESVEWLGDASGNGHGPARVYYVQDFEPYFFVEGSKNFTMAWESYTRYGDLKRITKTEWNRAIVKKNIGSECVVVGPSVNMDLYRPRNRQDPDWPRRPLRIAAMIRPNSPRRSPKLTMKILREISLARGNTVEIILFGCTSESLAALEEPNDFPWRNAGILNRLQMSSLLNEVDIFVDFSTFQAMGLTALEAMCCGVAVIVPEKGGAASFLKDRENGIAVDTRSEKACLAALEDLVLNHEFRSRLQCQAILDAPQFFPERAAFNTLNAVFGKVQNGSNGFRARSLSRIFR